MNCTVAGNVRYDQYTNNNCTDLLVIGDGGGRPAILANNSCYPLDDNRRYRRYLCSDDLLILELDTYTNTGGCVEPPTVFQLDDCNSIGSAQERVSCNVTHITFQDCLGQQDAAAFDLSATLQFCQTQPSGGSIQFTCPALPGSSHRTASVSFVVLLATLFATITMQI